MVLVTRVRKKRFMPFAITVFSCIAVLLLVAFFARKGPANNTRFTGVAAVAVQNTQGKFAIYRKGKPFVIKGGAGYSHLEALAAAGGNTIVCWDTAVLESVLREASLYKLAVIVGIDVPGVHNTDFYADRMRVARWQQDYSKLVNRVKNHPSLLAWCLGNELIFPYSAAYDPFYHAYNSLLQTIHASDPQHPVFTTVINVNRKNIFNLQWRVPALDFIGINSYNSLRTLQKDIAAISLFWKGPYIIAEWAPRGGWEAKTTSWNAPLEESSTQKAADYYRFYAAHIPRQDPRFMGSLVFYWGQRQEYTYTWYGVFNDDGAPTEIAEALRDCWRGTAATHLSPVITGIFADSSIAADNIMLSAGSAHTAFAAVKPAAKGDSLRYAWQVLKEEWVDWGKTWVNFKKSAAVPGLFADSTLQRPVFKAPGREGPYRLYVTVYNTSGYCATANIPFYVIE